MVYTVCFFSSKCSLFHNSNVFGSCFIHILYTGCAKILKNNSGPKRFKMRPARRNSTSSKERKFSGWASNTVTPQYGAPWHSTSLTLRLTKSGCRGSLLNWNLNGHLHRCTVTNRQWSVGPHRPLKVYINRSTVLCKKNIRCLLTT